MRIHALLLSETTTVTSALASMNKLIPCLALWRNIISLPSSLMQFGWISLQTSLTVCAEKRDLYGRNHSDHFISTIFTSYHQSIIAHQSSASYSRPLGMPDDVLESHQLQYSKFWSLAIHWLNHLGAVTLVHVRSCIGGEGTCGSILKCTLLWPSEELYNGDVARSTKLLANTQGIVGLAGLFLNQADVSCCARHSPHWLITQQRKRCKCKRVTPTSRLM
eukprot:20574-Amphidinium_carterae.3